MLSELKSHMLLKHLLRPSLIFPSRVHRSAVAFAAVRRMFFNFFINGETFQIPDLFFFLETCTSPAHLSHFPDTR